MKRRLLSACALAVFFLMLPISAFGYTGDEFTRILNDQLHYVPDDCAGPGTTTGPTNLTGKDNAEKIFNYLVSKGLTGPQAAGIVGNAKQENSFKTEDNAGGLGLFQWIGGRRSAALALAAKEGKAPTDIGLQLDYLWQEMNTTEKGSLAAVKATNTPAAAAIAFEKVFERCGNCQEGNRVAGANEAMAMFGANAPGAAPAAGATGADASAACQSGAPANIGGCSNPIPDPSWKNYLNRTDDGVDYHTLKDLPLMAICDMDILESKASGTGWPGPDGSSGSGGFIYAKLTSGPFKGKCWYYAEDLKDMPAKGAHIAGGQKVATAMANPSASGGSGIEVGFAKGMSEAAMRVGSGGYPGPSGKAAARFLRSLGAPTKEDPGPGAPYEGASCP